ncbi:zinc transporter ZIP11-like [Hydractinia symbiolongicarpus]|uniref:zinc transporter ZIP11-like n=1 Tax=Hydractinia symbiolongicarpus TaxID=13093 RepID=UPI00254C8DAF|nr:zinc transporter ZIP11-like [Hydractinia symbiolongicarpus]
MIEGENKILQAFLGTLLTWGLTAAGSATVFIFSSGRFNGKRKVLDGSLGFAAGVMTAASYWSLLAPAIEKATESGIYGDDGQYAFVPAAIGFAFGGLFVLASDKCIPRFAGKDPALSLAMLHTTSHQKKTVMSESTATADDVLDEATASNLSNELLTNADRPDENTDRDDSSTKDVEKNILVADSVELKVRHRKKMNDTGKVVLEYQIDANKEKEIASKAASEKYKSWKRMLLLIIAITVHNIPEGLAVGVSFGAIGSTPKATFESARSLAIGIGIQNFPEGMAVSVPLCAAGYSPLKSFWYGQLSGMVEPIFGVLGALVVIVAEPLLPYALAFAAGAMIYVVVDDIIPEANMCGNGRIASWGCMLGFVIMMSLDVGLG